MPSHSDSESNDVVLVSPGDVRDFNQDNILPLTAEDLVEIKEWLQPTPYDQERSEYSRHRSSHLAGTGTWLTTTKAYQEWHEGKAHGLLWLKGIPGSGKSVMAASIIEQLRKEDVPVLHFFFRQIIDANHQPVAALRDWLCQVLNDSPPLQVKLKGYMEDGRTIESLSMADLWKALKMALASFPKVYCITDALDEMDQGNEGFLHDLVDLGQWRPPNVKVLITSRPVATVENLLRSYTIPQIRLEERLVDHDIAAYVQYRLRNSSVPSESWGVIKQAVPGRANGLFLYAKLSLDAFVEAGADVQEVLKALPADLNVMYNDLLREHARRSNIPGDLQHLILQFVTHATRPLRLLEMAEMVRNTHAGNEQHNLKKTKDLVRDACGPLLEILPDETVSVVHHSFTEFLKGYTRFDQPDDTAYPVLRMGQTNERLVVACLDYLTSGCLDTVDVSGKRGASKSDFYPRTSSKQSAQSEVRLRYPFLEYAAGNWYIHLRRAVLAGSDMTAVYERLDGFFENERQFHAWLGVEWPTTAYQGVTPLHVAAKTGLDQYAIHIIERSGVDLEARDSRQNTPIYWAASAGHANVLQVLISKGANPDAEGDQGYKPLHQAASNNHPEAIRTLLEAGVDPLTPKTKETPGRRCGNAPTSVGHTPLMYACRNGHVEAVTAFLPFLNNIETCHRALGWAALAGHAAIVDLILKQPGVDVNSTTSGDSALLKACRAGDLGTIEVLLRAGADPNMICANAPDEFAGIMSFNTRTRREPKKHRGFTALHALCNERRFSSQARPECVKRLIEAGVDIDMKTEDGFTALHYACKRNMNLIRPLLLAGADPTVEADDGTTPLHTDGENDRELLPALLGTGIVNINKRETKGGRTPLLCRLQGYHSESVLLFLTYKPDVNVTDFEGNGPLHYAVQKFGLNDQQKAVIESLISAGADPNLKNLEGNTPMHCLRNVACFLQLLLDAGADIEAKNIEGQTPLFKSISKMSGGGLRQETQLYQFLLNAGAQLNTHDHKGRTLLHECLEITETFENLVRLGLNPAAIDHEGNTLLMEAASRTSDSDMADVLQYLLSFGLSMDQQNIHGRTVLHTLCSKCSHDAYRPMDEQPLEFVLRKCKKVDPVDAAGITPLHLAATVSEAYVSQLLAAGADPFKTTREGLTILHLASRARQSNIVWLVLSRLQSLEENILQAFIDQKDSTGRGAIHYACRSGRPETVGALLEAGADPNLLDDMDRSPFQVCAEFEEEQKLWADYGEVRYCGQNLNAAGLMLEDSARPFIDERGEFVRGRPGIRLSTEQDTTRLEEILGMLVQHGARLDEEGGYLQKAFHSATQNGYEYTAECFIRLVGNIPNAKPIKYSRANEDYLLCTYRMEATKRAFRESLPSNKVGEIDNGEAIATHQIETRWTRLLAARQYDVLEEIAANGADLTKVSWNGESPLHHLAKWGFGDLLGRIVVPEMALRFDNMEWCTQTEEKSSCRRTSLRPLLITACARKLPNMEVTKVLVEQVGVDIDAKERGNVYRDGRTLTLPAGGALHKLASGDNWWHVETALPYLIQKGANMELRDTNGATPLHIALDCAGYKGPFCRKAARILIENGADVNAVDDKGQTCLSVAGNDIKAIELLIANGATVGAAAIFSAIKLAEIDVLKLLLSQGNNANLRPSGPKKPGERGMMFGRVQIVASEMTPLLCAAMKDQFNHPELKKPTIADRKRMMKLLLEHGADPFAHIEKRIKKADNSFSDSSNEDENEEERWAHHSSTVIHEILSSGHLAEPLLQLPSLDIEHQDFDGCTLLLAACKRPRTSTEDRDPGEEHDITTAAILQKLLDRGANIHAQDNEGKTALHHIIKRGIDYSINDQTDGCVFSKIIQAAPDLVRQPDHNGNTPFHYALRERVWEGCGLLLQHGADPQRPDSDGNTALHHLAGALKVEGQTHDLFHRILKAGVDINSRNNAGDTPIFKYIEGISVSNYGFDSPVEEDFTEPVFELFKAAGANFFARNNAGSSLLHVLASKNLPSRSGFGREDPAIEIVHRFRLLMDMGLDPMAEDGFQRTSLDVAAACDGEHILKLFERKPME